MYFDIFVGTYKKYTVNWTIAGMEIVCNFKVYILKLIMPTILKDIGRAYLSKDQKNSTRF